MRKVNPVFLLSLSLLWIGCKDFGDQPKLPTVVRVSISDITVVESETALVVIFLSKPSDSEIIFDFASQSGVASDGSDFDSVSGSDTIPPGVISDTISVVTVDDSTPESSETFSLRLSALNSAEFVDSVAFVTIIDNDSVTIISFSADVKPLFDAFCASCHGDAGTQSGLSLETYTSVMTSGLRAPNVTAGNGGASRLYLATTTSASRDIDRMPQGGPYLTIEQQELIKTWIDQGALNN